MNKHLNEGVKRVARGMKKGTSKPKPNPNKKVAGLPMPNKARKKGKG